MKNVSRKVCAVLCSTKDIKLNSLEDNLEKRGWSIFQAVLVNCWQEALKAKRLSEFRKMISLIDGIRFVRHLNTI